MMFLFVIASVVRQSTDLVVMDCHVADAPRNDDLVSVSRTQ